MLKILNTNLNGEMFIKKELATLYYGKVIIAHLLDSDKKEICELYKEDDLVEIAEKLSKAKSADEIVDIMQFENMIFALSEEEIENIYLKEYKEGLLDTYDEDEIKELVKTEKEWFESTLKSRINRIGEKYILVNF